MVANATYQRGIFFARGQASFVQANNITAGSAFGLEGIKHSQGRLLIKSGVILEEESC